MTYRKLSNLSDLAEIASKRLLRQTSAIRCTPRDVYTYSWNSEQKAGLLVNTERIGFTQELCTTSSHNNYHIAFADTET